MSNCESVEGHEAEVLRGMEPFVEKRLKYLVGDKRKWWPSQFFDFMEQDDDECFERLRELRKEARELRDAELVVVVGYKVTEDGLPNYSRTLANLFPDPTGISKNPWNIWERGWAAEEDAHGRSLDRYLTLGGRVCQMAVDRSTDSLIERGMKSVPGLFRGLAYPAFQEPATAASHLNMAKIAARRGVKTLYDICSNISKDESRHAKFYSDVVSELMKITPERMIVVWSELMKDKVIMPALNMVDGTYPEPPTLFEHFAGVASKIGAYTTFDYADIVDKLNGNFKVANASVSGAAAKAQNYLCKLPGVLRRLAERNKFRIAEPVGFDWIYGRTA